MLILFGSGHAKAQPQFTPKHQIGFVYGKGSQALMNVVYTYNITLIQLQYGFSFLQRPKYSMELSFHPQYNVSQFRHIDQQPKISSGFEYGMNVGITYKRYIDNGRMSFFGGISFGPHYISAAPERQTSGFIFSDNVFIGTTVRLDKHFYLEFRPTFRHISNANIIKPNRGINNFILNAGILYYLP